MSLFLGCLGFLVSLFSELEHLVIVVAVGFTVKLEVKGIVWFFLGYGFLVAECEGVKLAFAIGSKIHATEKDKAFMVALSAGEWNHSVRPS